MRGRTAFCVAAAIVLAGCNRSPESPRLVGTLERDRLELIAEASEPILSIAVKEGDLVKQGQILLVQETEVAGAREAQAQALVAEAKQRLVELERGARKENIQEARARVAAARAMLDRDEREFKRAQELVAQRLVAVSRVDEARASRDSSLANRREAEAQLATLVNGTRIEQVEQARSALVAAESSLRQTALTDARLTVRASRDGIIEALPYKVGERPPQGSPVVIMLADSAPYARVYVPEPERARVKSGDDALVYVDGVAAPLKAKVRYVASAATFTPYYALTQRDRSRLAFLSEIVISDSAALRLPSGVPVEVEILGNHGG